MQDLEAGLDAAVPDIAANTDADAANEFRLYRKLHIQRTAILLGQTCLKLGLDAIAQRCRTFNERTLTLDPAFRPARERLAELAR